MPDRSLSSISEWKLRDPVRGTSMRSESPESSYSSDEPTYSGRRRNSELVIRGGGVGGVRGWKMVLGVSDRCCGAAMPWH